MLRSSSELLGSAPSSELQALLSPYKSAACWQESPLLRSFEVKNSELWLQMGPASAVCGELGLPSLERAAATWPFISSVTIVSLKVLSADSQLNQRLASRVEGREGEALKEERLQRLQRARTKASKASKVRTKASKSENEGGFKGFRRGG